MVIGYIYGLLINPIMNKKNIRIPLLSFWMFFYVVGIILRLTNFAHRNICTELGELFSFSLGFVIYHFLCIIIYRNHNKKSI